MAESIVQDGPRHTVQALLLAIEQEDESSKAVLAEKVLRSSFDHLFASYLQSTTENGAAMASILVLLGEVRQ